MAISRLVGLSFHLQLHFQGSYRSYYCSHLRGVFIKENKKEKKERIHTFDQERSDQEKKRKKNENGQQKKKENMLSAMRVRFQKNDNDQEKKQEGNGKRK